MNFNKVHGKPLKISYAGFVVIYWIVTKSLMNKPDDLLLFLPENRLWFLGMTRVLIIEVNLIYRC